ncbi:MAG: hypothetical protein JSV79_02945 [Armatimonadota bacterium]|nr:MAG: hypothetical protein JSV79_02945 [Armatimonadota bacterium]
MSKDEKLLLRLEPEKMLGGLVREDGETPIPDASWYVAEAVGDGVAYRIAPGALAAAEYLTADLLVDGDRTVTFVLALQEGEGGPTFGLSFSALNQCQARLRIPLTAVDQNRWAYAREGAWLKPRCMGDRVDLTKVDRMTITVSMISDRPGRFCLTPVAATAEEPERLREPILPKGPLIDELGQSTLHEWPGKSRSAGEVTERLKAQAAEARTHKLRKSFSRWGGYKGLRFEGTGFFRTHHDGDRWWLVHPEGYAFWSTGMDCVRMNTDAAYGGLESALAWLPEQDGDYGGIYWRTESEARQINYLTANFIRAFGPDGHYAKWSEIALGMLRRLGFNTVGNWSDWQIAKEAGFPYVRPLDSSFRGVPAVFRDFPDVFHTSFQEDAGEFAKQLEETKDDPGFIGYFLMNEPNWGFAQEAAAVGMLFNTPACEARRALRNFLKEKYGSDAGLAAGWGMDVTLAAVGQGEWSRALTEAAKADLEAFSTIMVEKLVGTLSAACKEVDPNHLNLGARYYTVPPRWALEGMKCFDVFSVNGYQQRVRPELEAVSKQVSCPVMIGEWHFGALDMGLPASGIGHVRDQKARGQAYRVYLEDAAAKPWCVGAHWFTLYDESALGRFDGENWNIGFLDVCNRPYEEICEAASASHERLYEVARGEAEPYHEVPEYLPLLFF